MVIAFLVVVNTGQRVDAGQRTVKRAVFLPSGGRFYATEMVSSESPSFNKAMELLESESKARNRLLSRSEIIEVLAASDLALGNAEFTAINAAVDLVQNKIAFENIFEAFRAYRRAVGTYQSRVEIDADADLAALNDAIPDHSVYFICFGPEAALCHHVGGGKWPKTAEIATWDGEATSYIRELQKDEVTTRYTMLGEREGYLYPDWHPLVLGLLMPERDVETVFYSGPVGNIATGRFPQNSFVFQELERIEGQECLVVGTLFSCVYVPVDGYDRAIGSIRGLAAPKDWKEGTLTSFGPNPVTWIRNEEWHEDSSVPFPTQTTCLLFQANQRIGRLSVQLEQLTETDSECDGADVFAKYEPYLHANEKTRSSESVGRGRTRSSIPTQSDTPLIGRQLWLIIVNVVAGVLVLVVAVVAKRRRRLHADAEK